MKVSYWIVSTLFICLFIVSNVIAGVAPQYNISTVLGGGSSLGDGELASSAMLTSPASIALMSGGGFYLADSVGRIRKVDSIGNLGNVTTFAGTGTSATSGDGGLATSAQLNSPTGVAVNSQGEVFISELLGYVIRKVYSNGTITTIAGTGSSGYDQDGVTATSAKLNRPYSVSVGPSGEVYIADSSNNRIRVVYSNGTIATFAGTGSLGYTGDGGAATSAKLYNPTGVFASSTGEVFISDNGNNVIRKVLTNGTIITVAGDGDASYDGDDDLATSASLSGPISVAVSSKGEIFISDSANNVIRKVYTTGIIETIAGTGSSGFSGDGGLATDALLNTPDGIIVDSNGTVFFSDSLNKRVRKLVPYCSSGYSLVNGECEVTCNGKTNSDATVCSGHGSCVGVNTCSCQSGWNGDSLCSTYSCENVNYCSNHGSCVLNNTCSCDSGWAGNLQCSQFNCVNNCNGRGSCVSNNTCSCQSGWKGDSLCSTYSCEDVNYCSNHGSCGSNNTCSCSTLYNYVDCSVYECLLNFDSSYKLVCSSSASSKAVSFGKLTSSSFNNLAITLNSNQQISAPANTTISTTNASSSDSSSNFLGASVTPLSSTFFTNVSNLVVQNSNGTLSQVVLSSNLTYQFSNLNINQNTYKYSCLRFDFTLNSWTNQSVSTVVSTNQVSCTTAYVSSVVVSRSSIVVTAASSTKATTATSTVVSSAISIGISNVILFIVLLISIIY